VKLNPTLSGSIFRLARLSGGVATGY
jgi:hypothetical protein